MPTPDPTPADKALKWVLRLSWLDGWSMLVIAVLSLLLTLLLFNPLGIFISLLILSAGVIELRGRRALKRRRADGMKLLVRSQLLVLTVILVYCARCLGSYDAGYVRDELIPEMRQTLLAMLGISLDDLMVQAGLTVNELVPRVHQMFLALYGGVVVLSLLFQGGLALFYRRKTALVTEALAAPPSIPAPLA
jgi:hypothetical protein